MSIRVTIIFRQMMFFLFLVNILAGFQPLTGVFYSQRIIAYNSSLPILSSRSGGYDFRMIWSESLSNIRNIGYSFLGYKVLIADNLLSFDGGIYNVTSVGGIFTLNPLPGTSIVYMYFSIIIIQHTSGYIQFQYNQVIPTNFSALPRTDDGYNEINVTVGITFTNDTKNYQARVFISCFYMASYLFYQQLGIGYVGVLPGVNTHKITFYTNPTYANIYPKIWYTYILFDISSFNFQISLFSSYFPGTFPDSFGSVSVVRNIKIPSEFQPIYSKCILGIIGLAKNANNTNYAEMYLSDYGNGIEVNITEIANYNNFGFSYYAFCIQNCSAGFYVDPTVSIITCLPCSNLASNCDICTPKARCISCTSNYYLLASVNICFLNCPYRYYNDNITKQCLLCSNQCLTCKDNLTCILCKRGWQIDGGCTTIDGCIKMGPPQTCLSCSTPALFYLQQNVCICPPGYFSVTHLCTNVIGCIATINKTGAIKCISCNIVNGFILKGNLCECKTGFSISGDHCVQICGDGRVFKDECDNGNNINGDGCSSDCKVQNKYICVDGSQTASSRCKYLRRNIFLSVVRIDKVDLMNQGEFTFSIIPNLLNFQRLNFTKMLLFQCNQSSIVNKIVYTNGQIKIYVNFSQNLEGNFAKITLFFDKTYFLQENASLTFNMISNGAKLILSSNIQKAQICRFAVMGLSAFALLIFIVSSFVHKMIGVQLLNTFQIIFLAHLNTPNYTQTYGVLKFLSPNAWNYLDFVNGMTGIDSNKSNLVFNPKSQYSTLLLMASLLMFACTLFAVTCIIGKFKKANNKNKQQNNIFSNKVLIAIYNKLLFPYSIGFLLVIISIVNTQITHLNSQTVLSSLLLFLISISSLIWFQEWSILHKNSQNYQIECEWVLRCKMGYLPAYLGWILLLAFLMSTSFRLNWSLCVPLMLGLQIVYMGWIILYHPYQANIHNLGIFFNGLCVIYIFALSILRERQDYFQIQQNQFIAIFGLVSILAFLCILSIIRTVYEISKFRREEQKIQNKKELNNQQQLNKTLSSNQFTRKSYILHKEKLNQIIRTHMMKIDKLNDSLI